MKNKNIWMLSVLVVLLFAAACGSDSDDAKRASDTDTGKVESDAGDKTDVQGGGLPAELDDVDVLSNGKNGDPESALAFEVGQSVGGVLGSSTGGEEDFDAQYFKLELTAGTVFEMEFSTLGEGFDSDEGSMAMAWFAHEDGWFDRVLVSIDGNKRQVFIPDTGTYYIEISDLRAGEEAHGGSESYYVLNTSTATLDVKPLTVPGELDGDMSDAKVRAFSVTSPEDGVMIAQAYGWDPENDNFLDPSLAAWDPVEKKLLGYNEDIDLEYEELDAELVFPVEKGAGYVLVLDFYQNTTAADFELVVSTDDDHSAYPALLTLDEASVGTIDAARDGIADRDYFVVEIEEGQTLRVEVKGDDALQAAIQIYDNHGFLVDMALPVGDRAGIEFMHPVVDDEMDELDAEDGAILYYVVVGDQRNIPIEESDVSENVGGATFGYTVKAMLSEVGAVEGTLPINDDVVLDDVGRTLWYEVTVPAEHILQLEFSSEAENFKPNLTMMHENGYDWAMPWPMAYISGDKDVKELFGVRDEFFRGGNGYEGRLNVKAYDLSGITYTEVEDIETNVSVETAQVVTLPVDILGEMAGVSKDALNADYFKASLLEDTTLIVHAGSKLGADMHVRLLKPDGTTLAIENNYYLGQTKTFYSAFVYDVVESGEYTLEIAPYCEETSGGKCLGNGDYTLKAFVADE